MNLMHTAIICLLLFFSGCAGLIFEIVWCRLLLRGLGAGTSASACVFAAFMAGAALGAMACRRYPKAIERIANFPSSNLQATTLDYFKAFGRLELIAGVSGISICFFLSGGGAGAIAQALGPLLANEWMLNAARFLLSFLLLLIPTSAMGASLAALLFLLRTKSRKANYFALLYGFNMLGAAIGCLGASFWVLPVYGISASALLASALNLIVFGTVEALAQLRKNKADPHFAITGSPREETEIWLLASVFISGSLALVFEIVWNRIFSLVLGASSYSLAAVLLMVLLGGGCASLLTQFLRVNRHWAQVLMIVSFFLAGIYTLATCCFSHLIFWIFMESSTYLSKAFSEDPFIRALIARMILASIYIFPPALFLSSVLPLATRAQSDSTTSGSRLYAFNCIGAALGCLLFNLFFFPLVSAKIEDAFQFSLITLAIASISVAFLMAAKEAISKERLLRRCLFALICLLTLVLPAPLLGKIPEWNSELMSCGSLIYKSDYQQNQPSDGISSDQQLLKIVEGINSTVTLTISPANNSISMSSDGKVESTLPMHRSIISPGSDISTHLLLGELPVLFHEKELSSALLIGLGSGVTASSLLSFSELKNLDIAEIEAAVASICKKNLSQFNGSPFSKRNLESGRINLNLCDARFLLLSQNKKYDVIVSQPADPWVSGSGDLFTEEFWRLATSRLNENGVFCQWVQLYAIPERDLLAIIRTFQSVFNSTCVCHAPGAGEIILIGFKNKSDSSFVTANAEFISNSNKRIANALRDTGLSANSGIATCYDALSMILLDPAASSKLCREATVTNKTLNTDDHPFVEFSTCRSMLTSESQLSGNFTMLANALKTNPEGLEKHCSTGKLSCSRLGRAYASQALQDSSSFKTYIENRALSSTMRGRTIADSPFANWSEAIVLRSLKKNAEAERAVKQALSVPPANDEDRLALFDIEFERDNLEKASAQLAACKKETLSSADGRLRQGFLQLRNGQVKNANETLSHLVAEYPCNLPALLGAAYASLEDNNHRATAQRFSEYLRINPWDFETQLALTSVLCKLQEPDEAWRQASCAVKLRQYDASALILVLHEMLDCDWKAAAVIEEMKQETIRDPNTGKILELCDNGKNPKNLRKNQWFASLINRISSSAECPKNGYKILGEP